MYTRRFWLDTETTGLDSRKSFAFQYGYIIEESGQVLVERALETRPEDAGNFIFEAGAEKTHGWPREKILALPSESEVFPQLMDDLKQYGENKLTLAGYNVDFDLRFFRSLFVRNNPEKFHWSGFYNYFDGAPFDVMQFAQGCRVAGKLDVPNLQLETLCNHFGLDTATSHSAMTDIRNTRAVFGELVKL
jgi:DNA polymerase III epsilon subunit-like protein